MHKNHHLRMRSLLVAVATVILFAPAIATSTVTAQAASVTPSAKTLKKSNSYYRKHAKSFGKKYKFAYNAQTALKKNGKATVWINTKDAKLKSSVKIAMNYWNKKLGKKEFVQGSKKHHTLTFSVSKAPATKGDQSDAWWTPSNKQLQVRWSYYQAETKNIGVAMTNQLNDAFYNKYAKTIEAQAKSNLTAKGITSADSDYQTEFNTEAQKVEKSLPAYATLEKEVKGVNTVAKNGRMYEYASTIAHELGHVMGLNHSPNRADLMYFESGSNNVYSYKKVKKGLSKYNPITKTDQRRAKLALKIYTATY
ncbi:matrixin family metalloprotease [Levilactobacillus tujiorum]|uniref:Matrixin family metalloprotease n=1 Tax=Levilactobacillus tujiorum TaxID=2912243 RepID=A0ABX1L3M5_9LACO|nr:matrixin family metalloprotease [Levilactobacillus tujiorum]MCH5464614.1 matrixin family metalloprotease [Levilactobacillus tujiorum]NLR11704.1 matrixin family metalloprotease [Lactobacillus sp. HBUAS51387]NLR29625.1 matrixin family metalloprotease [Levilactobacillus tujiorum]